MNDAPVISPPRCVARYARQATRCPFNGKKGYRTKRKALRIAERIKHRNHEGGVRVYSCSRCDRWHLTTNVPTAKAA